MDHSRPLRPALSPSRAADFQRCPLLFRFRVVDRLPEPPQPAPVRGTLVHSVLEGLFDRPAIERLPDAAQGDLAPAWEAMQAKQPELAAMFASDAEQIRWLDQASALIARYFELEDPRRLEPAERELRVQAPLAGGLWLRGFIDRVDVATTGAVRIVDYKTGKAPSERFIGQALFQLRCYALAWWRLHDRVPDMLQLLYLGDGQIIRHVPSEEELLATERKLGALWSAICDAARSGQWAAMPGRLCDWCAHRDHCPAFDATPPPVPEDVLARLGLAS